LRVKQAGAAHVRRRACYADSELTVEEAFGFIIVEDGDVRAAIAPFELVEELKSPAPLTALR